MQSDGGRSGWDRDTIITLTLTLLQDTVPSNLFWSRYFNIKKLHDATLIECMKLWHLYICKQVKTDVFSAFLKPDSTVSHLHHQPAFCTRLFSVLPALMGADVIELMISSKPTALRSYTDIRPPWCALGLPHSALHLSNSQPHRAVGILCSSDHNLCGFPAFPSFIIFHSGL